MAVESLIKNPQNLPLTYIIRSTNDREAFLREIESELSKIERERRGLGKSIKSWEAQFRIENNRNPSTDEKIRNLEYSRYRVLKSRRNFLQKLLLALVKLVLQWDQLSPLPIL